MDDDVWRAKVRDGRKYLDEQKAKTNVGTVSGFEPSAEDVEQLDALANQVLGGEEADDFHKTAVAVYETMERHADEGWVTDDLLDLLSDLPDDQRALFYGKRGAAGRLVDQILAYLVRIGSIVSYGGDSQELLLHPDHAISTTHNTVEVPTLAGHMETMEDPYKAAERMREAATEAAEERQTAEERPGDTAAAAAEGIDPELLANALAHGMWIRYEMAVTSLGETQEQLARLEEALRNRDQEIARLRSMMPKPSVTQIAVHLLSDSD